MRPAHTLLFLLLVLGTLSVLGLLWPVAGVEVAGTVIRMPSPRTLFVQDAGTVVDISAIEALKTDSLPGMDSTSVALDTVPTGRPFVLDTSALPPLQERIALHYPNGDRSVLYGLFDALRNAGSGAARVRVLHYGDSQIEGDRITSYIRHKLQSQFGGQGPGLVSVADITPFFSVERILSDNWQRYSVMGRKPRGLHHDRFGALGSFSRFTPILPDSVGPDTIIHNASLLLRPEPRAYGKARTYDRCRLFLGWHRGPLTIEVLHEGTTVSTEEVPPQANLIMKEWPVPAGSGTLEIRFTGADSPDVFGVSLEGRQGVTVDNLAMRGGAGYEFGRMDQDLLRGMYGALSPDLLILQFGGNVLPNITSADQAERYGSFFGGQIARFKRMIPGVAVIVIGPSDMSVKEGEYFVTRPFLEEVNAAMKRNTLAQGAVFWDMYAAMGGRNSMVSWVEADPPLAATDYTHFSPQGARKVGELFWTAFINDLAAYHKQHP